MILLIDNYDSFTYNLYQYLYELGGRLRVVRNDKVTVKEIEKMRPEKIIISPGPGTPDDAGVSVDVVRALGAKVPTLGVCLGHQAVGRAYGGRITRARRLMHGKTSEIRHDGKGIFRGVANPFTATRYHSLVVARKRFPKELVLVAQAEDGTVQALRHRKHPVFGVQFHPESIMTTEGKKILRNFLEVTS
ncbi:MAG: aminodeoxychorismate/anthranilate synthase component II [Acidobacteriota bacterium]|nr:MAG: aminodeoxychorismate/anthranilate synthase component II [Acidobacteriota bacterium]